MKYCLPFSDAFSLRVRTDVCCSRSLEAAQAPASPQKTRSLAGLRVWRTNPGSVFDYDPAEDNIQSRSLHMISGLSHRLYCVCKVDLRLVQIQAVKLAAWGY